MKSDAARMIAKSARHFSDPAERAAYLDRVCHGIARLRADVERILAEQDAEEVAQAPTEALRTDTGAQVPPTEAGPSELETAAERGDEPAAGPAVQEAAGDVIGRYTLVRELGQGGFGTVWLAEQVRPVRRQVALKIIKLGMDTAQVVARFEQERQALARMDHPNVARVLDAGATATGRPYFVMDLVQGEPVHEHCDRACMTLRDRLELFAQVCSAVQHAHTKGIIHRDLKPSNVLVGTRDGRPHATVIDFGIAKATSGNLADRPHVTEAYQVIGTLQYMSPEQAQASPDIDTRADVYSLGAILYEVLAGTTPHDVGPADRAAFGEILRAIRDVEPPPPSARVASSVAAAERAAAARGTDGRRLVSALRGDLDWITMRAIEKDRARRYESAEALAADVRRHLAGEPIVAAPPGAAYRVRKFVRRNRGLVAAGAAVAASLVGGVIAFAWQARAAQTERDEAVKARESEATQRRVADEQRDRAVRAESEAEARASELALVTDFQAGMLEQIDPTAAGRRLTEDVVARFGAALAKDGVAESGRAAQVQAFHARWDRVNATDAAREVIDRAILRPAVETLDRTFKDQPLVDARLRHVLAVRYHDLGFPVRAEPLLDRVIEAQRRLAGDDAPATLESLAEKGRVLASVGRYADAEAVLRDTLARCRRVLGDDHECTARTAWSLGNTVTELGQAAEGEALLREATAWYERHGLRDSEDAILVLQYLARSLKGLDRLDESHAILVDALERARRSLGDTHQTTLAAINNVGASEQSRGRYAEAEGWFRELVGMQREVNGANHPNTLITLGNLGFVLRAQEKYAEAEPFIRESLERRERSLGPNHPTTMYAVLDYGEFLLATGRSAEAVAYAQRAYEGWARTLGPGNERTLIALGAYSRATAGAGRGAEGEAYLRQAADRLAQTGGADSADALRTLHQLGAHLMRARALPEAERVLRDVVQRGSRVLGDADWATIDAEGGLCAVLIVQKKVTGARTQMTSALARRRDVPEKDLAPLVDPLVGLLEALLGQERMQEAEPLARDLVRIVRVTAGPDSAATWDAVNRLGVVLQRQDGRAAEAEPWMREALEGRRRLLGDDDPLTVMSVRNTWVVLDELGRTAEAAPLAREHLAWLRRTKGVNDPEALFVAKVLAGMEFALGRMPESEELLREVVAGATKVHGPDDGTTLEATDLLASAIALQGRPGEAVPLYRSLVERAHRNYGAVSPASVQALTGLAMNLRESGSLDDALRTFDEALPVARELGPTMAAVAATIATERARTLAFLGRPGDAVAAAAEVVADARARRAAGSLELASELAACAMVQIDAGAWDEAEALLREVVEIREKLAPDDWSCFNVRAMTGEVLLARRRYAEAEPLVVGGFEGLVARRAAIPPVGLHSIARGKDRILRLYAAWDAAEPGKGHDATLAAWREKLAQIPEPVPMPRRGK